MKRYTKEFKIGIIAVFTVAVIFFGINYLKGINIFKGANYYYASYTNVLGLAQSAPVTLNGFKVGIVREIEYEYDNPGHVRVEMSLNKELRVPRETEAVIVQDVLGTSSIELKMSAHPDYHEVGDHLIGRTEYGMIESLSGELLPSIGDIMPKIDSLITSLARLASNPALTASVNRLDNIMANIETTSAQLARMSATLPTMAGDANKVMANANTVSENLTTITEDLTHVSADMRKMPLDSTLNNVYQISNQLNDMLARINSDKSTLGLLMNDPQLYHNLNNSARSLDSLLIDVKRNPKRYISIKVF